jgi:hypothetical protein
VIAVTPGGPRTSITASTASRAPATAETRRSDAARGRPVDGRTHGRADSAASSRRRPREKAHQMQRGLTRPTRARGSAGSRACASNHRCRHP